MGAELTARSWRHTSRPSVEPSPMSSRIRSGWCAWYASMPARSVVGLDDAVAGVLQCDAAAGSGCPAGRR